jgi:hypothetical protein
MLDVTFLTREMVLFDADDTPALIAEKTKLRCKILTYFLTAKPAFNIDATSKKYVSTKNRKVNLCRRLNKLLMLGKTHELTWENEKIDWSSFYLSNDPDPRVLMLQKSDAGLEYLKNFHFLVGYNYDRRVFSQDTKKQMLFKNFERYYKYYKIKNSKTKKNNINKANDELANFYELAKKDKIKTSTELSKLYASKTKKVIKNLKSGKLDLEKSELEKLKAGIEWRQKD